MLLLFFFYIKVINIFSQYVFNVVIYHSLKGGISHALSTGDEDGKCYDKTLDLETY